MPSKLQLAIFSVLSVSLSSHAVLANEQTQLPTVNVNETVNQAQVLTTPAEELVTNGNSETGTALRNINGVDASRMGGHGVDLNIRGQSLSQLNILLDGAKIEGGCPNRMDPPTAYAELSSYDTITVIKGVGTLTQAAGGTGGTVLFERDAPQYNPEKPVSGEINLGTTDNGLNADLSATVEAVGEKGFIVLQGSKKSAENYRDGNGYEVRSSYESKQGHIDLGWTPNKHHMLKLSYEQSVIEDALFQGAMMDSPESDGRTTRLQYRGKDLNGFVSNIEFDAYHSDVDHIMDNHTLRTLASGSMPMINQTDVSTDGVKLKLTSMLGHTQLDYGIQTEIVKKFSNLKNGMGTSVWYMWPDAQTTTNSVFAESTSFFKDNQKVILGLRYDVFDAKADSADTSTAGGTPSDVYANVYGSTDTDNQADKLSALIRYERQLDASTEFYAGLSRSYRFADATELYIVKGSAWTGNPDLKPEQHNQFDMGIAKSYANGSLSASAYYDVVEDYILYYFDGANQRYGNVDAHIYGLELSGTQQISKQFRIGFDTNVTFGQNKTDDRYLANMTPLSGKLYTEYHAGNTLAGARINFAKSQENVNDNINELETAGWGTLDVYANVKLHKNASMMLGIDNVFDKAYQNALNRIDPTTGKVYNLNEPGRIAWAKVKVTF
nr:TonB-dependent receptor [Thiomicrorhabdus marina]